MSRADAPDTGDTQGVLQVVVRPASKQEPSAWRSFRNRLARIFGRDAADAVTDYARAADEAALEKLRVPGVKNAHIEADIRLTLAKARKKEAEARLVELEVDKTAALSAAEIQAKRVELQAKAIEQLQRLGVDITPLLENSELVGLVIERGDRSIRLRLLGDAEDDSDDSSRP